MNNNYNYENNINSINYRKILIKIDPLGMQNQDNNNNESPTIHLNIQRLQRLIQYSIATTSIHYYGP